VERFGGEATELDILNSVGLNHALRWRFVKIEPKLDVSSYQLELPGDGYKSPRDGVGQVCV